MEGIYNRIEKPNDVSQKENISEFKGVWSRVSEMAREIVYRDRGLSDNPSLLAQVDELLQDDSFKKEATQFWDSQVISGKIADDPKEQDMRWANGVALRIKNRIDN